ncbi:regulator of nonsense transcripts 3B [Xenopus laevis]|uniref:UPF3 domain-containing protein n=2 Tax=Xenopus laevis TaxID=8355 RepID=A0A974H7U5_XENLA|nr:regulator of nonsense transcripts 3B [Xenopus laevis]OCT67591.1 hypothetical protein XELAEV_18038888mg [Xenopus laevis]
MKEDKENAKPKERKGEQEAGEEGDKSDKLKEKKEVLSKVIIRRLPPSLTKEQLEEHLQPLSDHDYFEFFSSDSSFFPHMFSRAYINFKSPDDIVLFRDRFDGYVFIDHRGQEYPAIVEFAPFQKVAKKKNKKKDSKIGTIDEDPEYRKFLDSYTNDEEKLTSTPETLLEEIEAKNKEMIAKKTTPLLSFLKNRQRLRDEKREERRRRELERKKQREEERRKWKEDERRKKKEAEKQKKYDKPPEKELEQSKDEPKIKLLKKLEKEEEKDAEKKFKTRKFEKENIKEERCSAAKKPDGEVGEEKTKKVEVEYVKDYRDKDYREKDYRDKDYRERDYRDKDYRDKDYRDKEYRDKDYRDKEYRDKDCREKDYRDKEYDRERRQRDKEKSRDHEDDRRKPRDRFEKDRSFRRREEDYRKERDLVRERVRKQDVKESPQSTEISERIAREKKKEDAKRDRIRNKDRPAMQLYQPGGRSRSRLTQCDESPAKTGEQSAEKKVGDSKVKEGE